MSTGEVVREGQLGPKDIVIAVVGPSGVGKSTFIQQASGIKLEASSNLRSHTCDFTAYRLNSREGGGQSPVPDVVLIDTPGYDNDYVSKGSSDLLKQLSEKLRRLGNNIQLSGMLYMYNISTPRTNDNPILNVQLFQELCGNEALKRVILTTTMWDTFDRDPGVVKTEKALERDYWEYMLQRGSRMVRFDNKPASTWRILGPLIARELHTRWVRFHQDFETKNHDLPGGEIARKQAFGAVAKTIKENRAKINKIVKEMEKGELRPDSLQTLMRSLRDLEQDSNTQELAQPDEKFWNFLTNPFKRKSILPDPAVPKEGYEALCRSSVAEIVRDAEQTALIPTEFRGSDAQLVLNFLNQVLLEKDLTTKEGMCFLSVICKLAMDARVSPSLFKVEGITIDEGTPVAAEDGHSKVYKVLRREKTYRCKISKGTDHSTMSGFLLKVHLKEIVLWAHLSHHSNKNLLPFCGVVEGSTAKIYTLSPWMRNGTIRQYAETLPTRERLPLITDVADGLYYLHGLGLLHGNLKGSNILISDDERALLAEFGFSNFADDPIIIDGGRPMITPHWAAPELFEGFSDDNRIPLQPTQPSDIWSFGCVIYEVTTLRDPYYHLKRNQLLSALVNREHPLREPSRDDQSVGPNWIDDDVWSVIIEFLNFDSTARPNSQEARNAIRRLDFHDGRKSSAGQAGATTFRPSAQRTIEIDYERVYRLLLDVRTTPSDKDNASVRPPSTAHNHIA